MLVFSLPAQVVHTITVRLKRVYVEKLLKESSDLKCVLPPVFHGSVLFRFFISPTCVPLCSPRPLPDRLLSLQPCRTPFVVRRLFYSSFVYSLIFLFLARHTDALCLDSPHVLSSVFPTVFHNTPISTVSVVAIFVLMCV
jgi:hypothetical protein